MGTSASSSGTTSSRDLGLVRLHIRMLPGEYIPRNARPAWGIFREGGKGLGGHLDPTRKGGEGAGKWGDGRELGVVGLD